MHKFKKWIIQKFLPAWAKDTILKEVERLTAENAELKHKISERDAYIDGLETGMRFQRRVIINNATGKG